MRIGAAPPALSHCSGIIIGSFAVAYNKVRRKICQPTVAFHIFSAFLRNICFIITHSRRFVKPKIRLSPISYAEIQKSRIFDSGNFYIFSCAASKTAQSFTRRQRYNYRCSDRRPQSRTPRRGIRLQAVNSVRQIRFPKRLRRKKQ